MSSMRPRALLSLLLVALVSLVVVACGSGDDNNSSSGATGAETTSTGAGDSVVADARAAVEQASAEVTEFKGPAESPPPATGKHIYIVSCGPDTEGCKRLSDGATAGAKAIGWQSTVLQTDGSVQQFNSQMRQAIQRNADAILLDAFPTAAVAEPLKTAAAKGIPVVAMVSGDEVPATGSDFKGGLYSVVDANNTTMGKLAAQWIISETDGKADVGTFTVSAFPVLEQRYAGFKDAMAACSSCKLNEPVAVELTALVKDAAPSVAQFLRGNPSVNYMFSTFDGGAVLAAQGIRTAGDKVPMVGTEGNAPNLDMIRKGGPEVAAVATPLEWVGWAAIDQTNRAFNHEPPAEEWTPNGDGIPLKIVTKDNVPPEGQSYTGDIDFSAKFQESWGK